MYESIPCPYWGIPILQALRVAKIVASATAKTGAFCGILHMIGGNFLNTDVSCALCLYVPPTTFPTILLLALQLYHF